MINLRISIFSIEKNYSGKTILSRILSSLETGVISEKYNTSEFQISFSDGSKITQNDLNAHGHVTRVFNEDFIKDNLSFIIDDEKSVNSFAILGENNTKIEKEITNRINNEFSHLEGIFERSVLPIDVPEMKTTANFILLKIKEKYPDQYSALLQSIGVNEVTS